MHSSVGQQLNVIKTRVKIYSTSNVTGRHRGPKRNLCAGYRAPSRNLHTMCLLDVVDSNACHIFIIECGIARFLCIMHVFKVWASSSSPRLPLCHISFLLQPPWPSYHTEKNCACNHTQLI